MDIFVTLPDGDLRQNVFTQDHYRRLERLGNVRYNDKTDELSQEELTNRLADIDICISGWGTRTLDETILSKAGDLSLIAHIGGSVGVIASDALYDNDVIICSANQVMAKYVAEGVLTYILAGLRDVSSLTAEMRAGAWASGWERSETLFERKIGFIGLGTVGQHLLDLLDPFDVTALIYDPYADQSKLDGYNSQFTSLETTLSESSVVSIHASLTKETYHLLKAGQLDSLQDGALLINTARGKIIDQPALVNELDSGRIHAVLDVYEEEPLPADNPIRSLENATLFPHVAGAPSRSLLIDAVISEIERFVEGDPLLYEIPREQFHLMTNDNL